MAFDAVEEVLAAFPWLQDLGDEIYNLIVDGITNNDPSAVIIQSIRDSSTYKQRFKGLVQRRQAGLPAISEREYLEVEQGYLNQLRNFNIQGTLGLTDSESFREFAADLISKDVSVQEFNQRLDMGVAMARDTSQEVLQAFQEFYGVTPTEDALLVYSLDPDRGLDIIEDQIASAQVGGEAFRYGLNISRSRAEILRREGVTQDLARQGFADVAQEEPVLRRLAQIHRFKPLSQQELEDFVFHEDQEVAERRRRTLQTALAEFQGGGSFNRARTGGLGELIERGRTV